jgi:hypothetical protein
VAEVNSGKLRIILPNGTISTDTSLPLLGKVRDVAITSNGTQLFALTDKHHVATFSKSGALRTLAGKSGTSGSTGDNGNATAALLNSPFGIAADPVKGDKV